MKYITFFTLWIFCLMFFVDTALAGTVNNSTKRYVIRRITGTSSITVKGYSQPLKQRDCLNGTDVIQLRKGEGLTVKDTKDNDARIHLSYDDFPSARYVNYREMTINKYLESQKSGVKDGGVLGSPSLKFDFVNDEIVKDVFPDSVNPEKRIALIIGNAHYNNTTWNVLPNSINDAIQVSKKLRSLGFHTITVFDTDAATLSGVLQYFYEESSNYRIKLLYYVGHGLRDGSNDYIVPIDDDKKSLNKCQKIFAIADSMHARHSASSQNELLFIDACRDTVFSTPSSTPPISNGTIIIQSTSPHKTAKSFVNESDENSPFAQAFMQYFGTPNDNLSKTISNITSYVISKAQQEPTSYPSNPFDLVINPVSTNQPEPTESSFFYWGASAGYLYGSAYIGCQFDISKSLFGLVELGWSVHLGGKSDEVYLYNTSNVAEYAYTYCPDRFLCPKLNLGVGYNFNDNISLSVLYGVSYLGIKGTPIAGYESGKGNKAAAICYSPNLRAVWTPRKSKPWKLQLTIGYDFAKGDDNYGVLKDIDQIKGMVEGFRCQIGFIRKF